MSSADPSAQSAGSSWLTARLAMKYMDCRGTPVLADITCRPSMYQITLDGLQYRPKVCHPAERFSVDSVAACTLMSVACRCSEYCASVPECSRMSISGGHLWLLAASQ